MEPSWSHIPSINLQPPAVDFIDNRLDSYHPAFATPPSRYDASLGAYIVCEEHCSSQSLVTPASGSRPTTPQNVQIPQRQLSAEPMDALEFWDTLFPLAMDLLKEKHSTDPDIKQEFKIRDKADCTSVFDQLEKAKDSYSKKDKGFKATFTRVYRKLADNVDPVIGATKFVPNIDYVTPVLGAVQVLLEAAKKAAKVREEALSSFDDIDKVFKQVEGFLHIYKNDKNLEKAAIDLIAAVFHAIECVISFFIKSPGKRVMAVTFNPEGYQQRITESLAAIKAQSENLIYEADMSGKYETSNGLHMVLDPSEMERMAYNNSRPCSPIPPMARVNFGQYVNPQDLLDWIDIRDLRRRDLERINRARHVRVPAIEQAHAEQLVHTAQLKEWLVSPRSSQLLVHGNFDSRRRVSGLTLLCASLADSLGSNPLRCIHLVFYCGLHDNCAEDEHTGGRAIIQSFICQLLCQYDFSTSISADDVRPDLLYRGDIHELCCLFERLVFQLPRSTLLVCLIDGIVYYEREEFKESMADVLVTILRISDEQKTDATVKVLVTSPMRTILVRRPFPHELILSMESRASAINLVRRLQRLDEGRLTQSQDADGPCDYCRSIDEVCSVDMEKRRQKPFYFVSEEEYRLLRELCSNCFPDEELTIPNLRRLIDENKKPTFKTQTDIATPIMSLIEVSAEAPLIDCGDESIDQGGALLHDVEESQEEEILLPEIVNLHHDLGCLLADAHGEYRYMGAESGASFNSAVRSWMLRMGAGTRSREKDKDKIPGMLKVSPPSVKSPLTDVASSPGNPCQFPSQDLLSACAARFFEQVHCLYWIYSAESFYTRLETTYSGDNGQMTASWLCSLHGIVALCASCEPSPNGLVNGQRAHDSLEMAKSLVTRVCDEADLDSIRALIVLSLAFQSNGFTNSAYLHIGLAVRIAFSLGLHLDKYSTKSGVVSQAHARRLWWTLYLVDQDLSLALGKPSMNSPPNETSWKPPLPSEFVVSPGSHTPNGYLEQCIRLAQITQSIRQNLYDGPVHGGQKLSRAHFDDSISSLQDWLEHVPPHLHLSPSVSLSYRRSISLLHLRYWSTMMLVTKPFLLCNLLQGIEHVEAVKQPIFATLAKTCVSAAESTFEILESMVLHKVASSLVMADYLFALQALQVIVAACGLYHMDGHQARAKQCLRILLAISVSGYPKHLIPETLFQLQQCGLAEGVEDTSNITLQPSEALGYPQMVTEPLQRISLEQSTDQLAMTWLNELDMADIVVDNGFLDNLMDISSIFPFGPS
ncbi:hypothetical protein FPRO05_07345 [Fusarium proliferatum]|uniref:Xylanolytic transcriptional activator regulatory domain-containing protein n=1 Tax=Gibberella intermedia TaxID=948311 RepID=A0A365MKR1_GIBIN|nr:hypothetical protein FPRO05_07345 [Fusarium proliferatum]